MPITFRGKPFPVLFNVNRELVILLTLWMLVNIGLFVGYFVQFQTSKKYFYMRQRTKEALAFARGPAQVINFNMALILLSVCRNLISFIRGSCMIRARSCHRLLDKNITFHKYIAWMIVFASAIHTIAHYYNYERFVAFNPPASVTNFDLPNGSFVPDESTVVVPENADTITVCFTTWAGVTGHIMVVVLFLMVTSSFEFIRRSFFEVFWYTHHLFVIFMVALAFHQYQELLPVQLNTDDHDPEFCRDNYFRLVRTVNESFANATCPVSPDDFRGAPPLSWKWMVGPFVIYIIERIVRFTRSLFYPVIVKVVEHPSKVMEIQFRKKGFHAEVGQYVFLNCPKVALFEWHPMTLTSAPEEDYFSVHIRIVGDWTTQLSKALGVGRGDTTQSWQLPSIAVDGPFGTASEDVFNYEAGVLVGAGIGVTPFASILKSVWYKLSNEASTLKIKRLYFFWVCPDTTAFEWFADLLRIIENQLQSKGINDFLEYHIYLTRGWKASDARNIMLHEDEAGDAITGLQQKTHYGRPRWSEIFESISRSHPNIDVGVFFCGPAQLSQKLHRNCIRYSTHNDPAKAKFFFNKENF